MFEFIESAAFEKFLACYLDEDEYGELQQYMMRHPEESSPALGVCENSAGDGKERGSVAGCA